MTLGKAREHAMSKKLRKIADIVEEQGSTSDATNFRSFASQLDLTILSLGIWRNPDAIEATGAYKQVKRHYDDYVRDHPGARV